MKVTIEKLLEMKQIIDQIIELKVKRNALRAKYNWESYQNTIHDLNIKIATLENTITDFMFDYDWTELLENGGSNMIIEKNGKHYLIKENAKSWTITTSIDKLTITFNIKKTDYKTIESVKEYVLTSTAF